MVDITDFVAKYNGIYVEVSGTSALNQCVDCANLFIRDVLKLPMIEWTNAKDFPSKAGDKYTWTVNALTNVPEEGDLIVWDGVWGHIAIFMDGNVNDFHSFDENYPTGTPCHIQYHNYTNVKGWLRCKNPPTPTVDCDPHWRIERDDNYNLFKAEQAKVAGLNTQITNLSESLKQANDKIQKVKTIVA